MRKVAGVALISVPIFVFLTGIAVIAGASLVEAILMVLAVSGGTGLLLALVYFGIVLLES